MLRSTKYLSRAIELAAVIAFVTTTASYLDRPLRDDETDWPRQARAIVAHGVPRVSFDEDRVQHGGSFYGYDAVYGLEHPPLYNHTLAAAARRWLCADTPARQREIAMAACLAVVTPVMIARVVVSQDDRGPLRPFSDRGFRATVDWLNGSGDAGIGILSGKDFGQYFHGPVFPLEDLLAAGGQAAALTAARRPDVRYIVDSSKYPLLAPGFYRPLDIARIESVDDFRIHVKR